MKRRAARLAHELTNITGWFETPGWDPGHPAARVVCRAACALPFSLHRAQLKTFFKADRVIAVSGESVVVCNGSDRVDKFMFRYPGRMALDTFEAQVAHEVNAVTQCLAGVALATEVTTKPADIFRWSRVPLPTVVQTQRRLDLEANAPLDLAILADGVQPGCLDKTARDLDRLLDGTGKLKENFDYTPDLAPSSGNLRRNIHDGSVTLIDVMPIYANGGRLIGDRPPDLLAHIQDNIQSYQEFVGRYGG